MLSFDEEEENKTYVVVDVVSICMCVNVFHKYHAKSKQLYRTEQKYFISKCDHN